MSVFLYKFFHNETNDKTEKGLINIPSDKTTWPSSWSIIKYKQYNLFKEVVLPLVKGDLFTRLLSKRTSQEKSVLANVLTLPTLSYILQCGYGLQNQSEERKENRTVPSGGKRYPLEVYVFLFSQVDTCKPGIYHYSVKNHTLEPVVLQDFSEEDIMLLMPFGWTKKPWGFICITSIFERSIEKYGSRGYRYVLLEAGHVAQNMLLAATENNLSMLPNAGSNEVTIENRIGLSGQGECVIYTLFF